MGVARVATVCLLAVVAVPSRPYVIRGDRAVGPIRIARTTASQAIVALPGVAHRAARNGTSCRVAWPGLALTVDFALIGTDPRDPCAAGAAVVATAASRGAWRTAVGLRVGDTVARVRFLYPHARRHGSGYWLVPRRACAEVGGFAYPGLLARTQHGRVTALVSSTAICD